MAFKINIVVRLQHWMDSVPGQTFLNYAYSWGAAIVILGALFKLTHLSGGDFMLFIGMGTEVVVFFLSAFDRPFDKNEIGKELPHDYETDEEIAARLGLTDEEDEDDEEEETEKAGKDALRKSQPAVAAPAAATTGVVFVGGGNNAPTAASTASVAQQPVTSAVDAAAAAIAAKTPAGEQPFENEAQRLAEIIRLANDELLRRAQAALSPEMEAATQEYIEKLRVLAETFHKVDEQSARLAHDSEEMANLNRTLTAINKTYELHFKSISQQVGTIEQINEQTRRLASQIEELNGVYGRMIQALTVNMRMQAPAPQPETQGNQPTL
ncbi:GldL family protein [gut metagenome]|uniref:GldL family protein n=1 Tax=gut metagenome TaxID=749906 RepID=J9G339_9ZZZZ